MAFVQLDANGNVVGMFGVAQNDPAPPGYAVIADNDPRIAAFLNAPPTPAQQADAALEARIAAGFAITSTGGGWTETFALDQTTLDQIGSMARDCASGMGLPQGAATFSYPDINGNPGPALTPRNMIDVYKALRDYMAAATQQAAVMAAGGTPQWPAASKTIA
jgi:hypothetical protein